MLHDRSESRHDKTRLVALTEKDVVDATRILALLRGERPAHSADSAESVTTHLRESGGPDRAQLIAWAKRDFDARRMRYNFLSRSMFGEAAWEILIVLYITEHSQSRHSVSKIAELCGSPLTSSVRWLDYLEREKYLERSDHPTDRRTVLILLTDLGRSVLDSYYSAVVLLSEQADMVDVPRSNVEATDLDKK
jgi:DNA-binding MarR family transcriptional regulator